MRKLAIIAALLAAFVVWAGTRAVESAAAPPTAATAGVSLSEVTGCRASVRVDAGYLTSGSIIFSYYDAQLGWVESASALNCTTVGTRADGGGRQTFVCADMEPLARYGRIAAHSYGVTQDDGGAAKTRIECFGPDLP